MNRLALLGFGARLAVTGGGQARVRVAMMAAGMAIGVALLLGLFSVIPAVLQHNERAYGRFPSGATATTGARVSSTTGLYRGRGMTTYSVYLDGPVTGTPPGLEQLPLPGEVVVSPALRDVLAGPRAGEVAPRVPGRVIGTVASAGLIGPRELVAWVGKPPPSMSADTARLPVVRTWGRPAADPGRAPLSDNDRVALGMAFVGLLIPLAVLITTMSRLSAASRERRLAALRLVGATRRQTRWFAAGETGAAALAGLLLGGLVFLVLRGPVTAVFPVEAGVFPGDVRPSFLGLVVVLIGVPALAAGTSILALRAVVTSPLAVTRRRAPRAVGWWRLVPLTLGMLGLVGAWVDRRELLRGGTRGAVLLVGGAGLALIGLAVAAPAVAQVGGVLLRRWGRGPASELAGRRLETDPTSAARVVTGAMLLVAVVAFLLGFFPLLAASSGGDSYDAQIAAVRPGTMTSQITLTSGPGPALDAAALAPLAGVRGVRAVAVTSTISLSRTGKENDFGPTAVVGTCRTLARFVRGGLPGCGSARAYRLTGPYVGQHELAAGGRWYVSGDLSGTTVGSFTLPDHLPTVRVPDGLSQLVYGSMLLQPSLTKGLPIDGLGNSPTVLVSTDGRAATAERVRSAMWDVPTNSLLVTLPEAKVVAAGSESGFYRAASLLGVAFALLAAALSFAVTTADSLRERGRGLASLVALGAPVRVLRRSVMLEVAVPLLLNLAMALGMSIIATWLYLSLVADDGHVGLNLPWADWSRLGAAALVSVLAATVTTLPFLRARVRPEALRTE